jgi:hypothetical protein
MTSKKFNREQMQGCLAMLDQLTQSGLSTLSSTLPERKWLISLETDLKAQTTKWAWRGLWVSVASTPARQTVTFVPASSRSVRSESCPRRFERFADECV